MPREVQRSQCTYRTIHTACVYWCEPIWTRKAFYREKAMVLEVRIFSQGQWGALSKYWGSFSPKAPLLSRPMSSHICVWWQTGATELTNNIPVPYEYKRSMSPNTVNLLYSAIMLVWTVLLGVLRTYQVTFKLNRSGFVSERDLYTAQYTN